MVSVFKKFMINSRNESRSLFRAVDEHLADQIKEQMIAVFRASHVFLTKEEQAKHF